MFETQIDTTINSPTIQVPQYNELKGKKVRVVFIADDNTENNNFDFINYYTNNPITLNKNITFFSRDEVNER